jgi:branched-chain amino acid transport system permease protein
MFQILLNTITMGAAYSLLATGFVLALNATGAVNLGHGAFVVVGGFLAAGLASGIALPGIAILPLVLVASFAVGVIFAVFAYYPFRNGSTVTVFISTISAGIVLETLVLLVFGASPRIGPALISDGTLRIGGATVSVQSLSIMVVAAALVVGQYVFLNHTKTGKQLRAVAQDRDMALALGTNVNAMIFVTFGIAAALAGASGLMFANAFYITPGEGESYLIKTYVAVALGGWGSLRGAVVGAFIVAAFEVLVPSAPALFPELIASAPALGRMLSPTASVIGLYLTFLAVLFVRPQGLFGETVQQRA